MRKIHIDIANQTIFADTTSTCQLKTNHFWAFDDSATEQKYVFVPAASSESTKTAENQIFVLAGVEKMETHT